MSQTTLGTVERLLASAMEETSDPEVIFKLRQALQLVFVVEDRCVSARETIEEADLDPETRANLRELGYVE